MTIRELATAYGVSIDAILDSPVDWFLDALKNAPGAPTEPPPPAPIDCVLSEWGPWEPLSEFGPCRPDGTQVRTERRTRTIVTEPANGGLACGPTEETREVSQPCVYLAPTLQSFTMSSASTTGGSTVTGTIALSSPAVADLVATVTNSDAAGFRCPSSVVIPAGQTSASFGVTALSLTKIRRTTLTVRVADRSLSAVLKSVPPTSEPEPTTDPEPEPETEPLPESEPTPDPEPPPDPTVPSPTSGSAIVQHAFPRLLLTPEMLTTLRARIRTDAAFRTRWQTAITQFESPKSTWNTVPTDQYACAFAAFLAMVRRHDDDLGLTWTQPWTFCRERILSSVFGWTREGRHEITAISTALIYDCLHADLTDDERTQFLEWIELGFSRNVYLPNAGEVWDNGNSDDQAAKVLCALVSPEASTRFAEVYTKTLQVADGNDWMGLGFGINREWQGGVNRWGIMLQLYALKHAGGLTDAQTVDHFLVHLRDAWQLMRHAVIPHPAVGRASGAAPWTSDKFHTQDPIKAFHRQPNVAAHMAWALAVLPGKVDLDASGMADRSTLAESESDLFGALWSIFEESINDKRLRDVLDVTLLGKQTSNDPSRFGAFPAWLIHGAAEYPLVSEDEAGIPHVRRFWPGTLEWIFITSPDWNARTRGSVIRYTHRRYAASQYEEGTKQNGRWHVHRDGPLLIQRGETGHGVTTRKWTWCANGAVTFIDPNLYPLFTYNIGDDGDQGGVRNFVSRNTKDEILAEPTADFGTVDAWFADDRVVALTSDLTRSYNSSLVQYGPNSKGQNAPKIGRFVREFVVIRRGGDGTDREKVFTYDRIELLDTKFEPRYNLSPAANPDIDGLEVPLTPWGPDQGDAAYDWYAVGPTHWRYDGATRLVYDNRAEPKAGLPGNGKVCVTWLQPTDATIVKAGGPNARSKTTPRMNEYPFFSPWRGWSGKDEWGPLNTLEDRAYIGLYTVTVQPRIVAKDTRFLMACEVMAAADTPAVAQAVPCDPTSVAARCGATVVVFGKDGTRGSGWVDVPAGVELVVVVNHARAEPLRFASPSGRVTF